jgi:phenylalanyl-tRNA synthetase alpha chain
MDIEQLKKEILNRIEIADKKAGLDKIKQDYLGKNGKLNQLFKEFKNLSQEQKKVAGQKLNELKFFVNNSLKEKTEIIETSLNKGEFFDVTLPGKKIDIGHIHPLSQVLEKCGDIFEKMGFSIVEGPEIENEWYNFDALNIPKDHPARDAWDTFWLKNKNSKALLRTHTSPVQIRYMEKNKPPFRIIVPGKVFRYEATDASHEMQFYQLEGLMVDKDISIANFRGIIKQFLDEFFERDIEFRMRPGFFPFTEPSFEIDIKNEKGVWLESLGAGMVHPNVLKNAGINPKDWQGFAFGLGIDRFAMIKYKINDIRLFYGGDLRFLTQF